MDSDRGLLTLTLIMDIDPLIEKAVISHIKSLRLKKVRPSHGKSNNISYKKPSAEKGSPLSSKKAIIFHIKSLRLKKFRPYGEFSLKME